MATSASAGVAFRDTCGEISPPGPTSRKHAIWQSAGEPGLARSDLGLTFYQNRSNQNCAAVLAVAVFVSLVRGYVVLLPNRVYVNAYVN